MLMRIRKLDVGKLWQVFEPKVGDSKSGLKIFEKPDKTPTYINFFFSTLLCAMWLFVTLIFVN